MAVSYQTADDDVNAVLASVIDQWHQDLKTYGVRIGVLMATNPDGDAVKHSGYRALAKIKIVGLKDRVLKHVDAEMIVDQQAWDDMEDAHRIALLDHECSHLAVKLDKKTKELKLDDLGRPCLKTVYGDWGGADGFADVVARHGDYSCEVENARKVSAMIALAKAGEVPNREAA